MNDLELKLEDRQEPVHETVSMKWKKPEGFEFRAGQFLQFFFAP
jgi:hypothetical protein